MDEETKKKEEADLDKLYLHLRSQGREARSALDYACFLRLRAHLDTIANSDNPDPELVTQAANEYSSLVVSHAAILPEDDEIPQCVRDALGNTKTLFDFASTPEFRREEETRRRREHRANWERRRKTHRPDNAPLDVGIWDIAQSLRDISYWLMFVSQRPGKGKNKTKREMYGKPDTEDLLYEIKNLINKNNGRDHE